jgi:CTP:molybdopterin cytidylyltransferase MocA
MLRVEHAPMTHNANTTYHAVILAADRSPNDPLLHHAGVSSKSLVEIGGTPMILRVLKALEASEEVGQRLLSGPSWSSVEQAAGLREMIRSGAVQWLENQATPSTSAYNAMQTIDSRSPVLLTTADHPLLSAEITDYFCRQARNSGLDLAVGLASYARIQQAFPGIRKTVLKFRDGDYCGCNLFAFLSPAAREAADHWRRVEKQRKKPWRVASMLGWSAVFRYLLGRLSLTGGLQGLSERLDLRIGAIHLPFADAAIDVDTIGDYAFAQQLIRNRQPDNQRPR